MALVAYIGRWFLKLCKELGDAAMFLFRSFSPLPPYYWHNFYEQIIRIGFYSIPIVGMTALFTGVVLALQTYVGFARFASEGAVASVVVVSITRELGPVISGLMLAARVGSSMAAEIASMKHGEQLDALTVMGISIYRYIFSPRIIAGVICMPLLVLIADVIGVLGGAIISASQLGFVLECYLDNTIESLEFIDVLSGVVKGVIFGLWVTYTGCLCGFKSSEGAWGVAGAAIKSVMVSCVGILFFNYIVTTLFV